MLTSLKAVLISIYWGDYDNQSWVRLAGAPRQDSLLKFEVLILSPRVGFNLPPILSRHHHVLLITRRVVAQVTL